MTQRMTATEVRDLAARGGEYALLDMREEGDFSEKRLMLASCLPLSRLELRARMLVPRLSTPLVIMDGAGEGLAEVGAERLSALGYEDIVILDGGVAAWEAAGLPVYSGVNVLTKAFGEVIHRQCGTPDITARELKDWIDDGKDLVILDARPYAEYHEHTIPGSLSVPGAELAARAAELAPSPDTTIVVNCAGRTRSIIGCQSLINAGLPNRVHALRNGTMGWKLAGFNPETGATRNAAASETLDADALRHRARNLAEKFDVTMLNPQDLATLKAPGDRNVYLFDVRTPDAFCAGHVAGSVNAPGGQLVQAMDDYVAVRNGIVVLVDPLLMRAVMTASWLNQVAQCETYVLDPCPPLGETGKPESAVLNLPAISRMTVADLAEQRRTNARTAVVDYSVSVRHREGHIPGAFWAVRGREAALAATLGPVDQIVLTGEDADLLQLVAPEIAQATGAVVACLDGDVKAWKDAGHPVETGMTKPIGPVNDVWYKPFELDDPQAEKKAAEAYLDWEVELTEKVARDLVDFRPMTVAGKQAR
ncbi:hypothetical protein K7H91_15665 [Martelella mediterranea]|uniref:rhodanese-like domain-containing protein n=1 Tax=Martelella mediterranea TaxID=293089 RepID=UPI001E4FFE9B|nr:rhodanese-like domain-containing protein [Martelella mediterranea]MCD1635208.1 hypothetical protein [Martelella mediterranea]